MPIGGGLMPAAGTAAYTELTYVVRRAFMRSVVVQIWQQTPLLSALIGNAQTASGGLSSVTQTVQGTPFVTQQWAGYSGSFQQPNYQQGDYNAEYNLKLMICPIPFLGMEGLVQQDYATVPLIEQRMNDAVPAMRDGMATALFTNTTQPLQFIGLPGAIDDGTNLATYGNINRTTNTWWKSTVYAAGGANPTRQNLLQYIIGTTKNSGGEMPTFGICGMGTWALLAQDFQGQESYQITPGSNFTTTADGPGSAFLALNVAGVPIYCDPYCPEGTVYLVNHNYLSLFMHELAQFAFTGFTSTLPNFQIGFVGAVVTAAELIVSKCKALTRIGGFASVTL